MVFLQRTLALWPHPNPRGEVVFIQLVQHLIMSYHIKCLIIISLMGFYQATRTSRHLCCQTELRCWTRIGRHLPRLSALQYWTTRADRLLSQQRELLYQATTASRHLLCQWELQILAMVRFQGVANKCEWTMVLQLQKSRLTFQN